ncbi:hypothetical protein ER308_16840 [Egibacter rhizosphaerae]|uniref:Formyl transferase N-terminal domain-containing protein n=1 Tax=Egibacter rhizosphaerae TaxID=1670831 RepID=A0A411YID7_9ACTN|nr:formyltransferase family protein [Egibacter rhizosphaerae]QBI21075.1 hypothetical protein ER308_16840 [Egibacter rhizosphaerae]
MPSPAPTRLHWLFAGEGVMGASALDALARTHPPAAVFTPEPLDAPVAAVAHAHGLPTRRTAALGRDPARQWPALLDGADLGVCACWPERLHAGALDAPRDGWVNLHPSALPAWRGHDPVGWQLLTAPRAIGGTVHRMTRGQDAGPILARTSVPVGDEDDRESVLRHAGERLGRLATELLEAATGRALPAGSPQDEEAATWCPPAGTVPTVEPRAMTAAQVVRVARAFSPRPGITATTLPMTQRLARPTPGELLGPRDAPGLVAAEGATTVALACRDRWCRFERRELGGGGPDRTYLGAPEPYPPAG